MSEDLSGRHDTKLSIYTSQWRRNLLFSGDYFLGGVLAAALTKLNLRRRELQGDSNQFAVECMLIIACVLKLGKDPQTSHPIDADSGEQCEVTRK